MKHWRHGRAEKKAREVSAIYREGVGRLLSGDVKKAQSLLQRALERDPARIETLIALASVHLQQGTPLEAVALLQKARHQEGKNVEVLFKLAATYETMGKDEEVCQAYEEILALERDNRKALRSLRDRHMLNQRWRQALELQNRLFKVGVAEHNLPQESATRLALRYEVAGLTFSEGQLDQAKSEFKEILKQDAKFTPAYVSLGDVFRAQRRRDDAVRTWQEGYQAQGKSIFLSRLEDLYMDAEDPASLLAFYRAAVLQSPEDLMLRLFFGKLCLRLEMVDEAFEQLYAVESAGVDSPQLHLLLAEAHRRRNRIDESINEYKKALGVTSKLRLAYVCDHCGEQTPDWQSRCPDCGSWGSFSLSDRKAIQAAKLIEMREIHHGERQEWIEE
jgi:lipopolysaccharide biosynthesis regulator YciM